MDPLSISAQPDHVLATNGRIDAAFDRCVIWTFCTIGRCCEVTREP